MWGRKSSITQIAKLSFSHSVVEPNPRGEINHQLGWAINVSHIILKSQDTARARSSTGLGSLRWDFLKPSWLDCPLLCPLLSGEVTLPVSDKTATGFSFVLAFLFPLGGLIFLSKVGGGGWFTPFPPSSCERAPGEPGLCAVPGLSWWGGRGAILQYQLHQD